jgi:osmotically-inducible protein OsmY
MVSTTEIERALEAVADIHAAVEERADVLVLTGLIGSEGERQAALDIVTALAPEKQIEDNLELAAVLPEEIDGMSLSEAAVGDWRAATPETQDNESLEPGDFTDQQILENPYGASGPGYTAADEEISEGEEAYVPPTDPPRSPDNEVLGGFSLTSMDETGALHATSGGPADEAIAEAVRRELREDAATTDLDVRIAVRNGIVYLDGKVPNIVDAENVEDVAARVPEVREIEDRLEIRDLE